MNRHAIRQAAATLISAFGAADAARRFGINEKTIRNAANGRVRSTRRVARLLLDAAEAVRFVQECDAKRAEKLRARRAAEDLAVRTAAKPVLTLVPFVARPEASACAEAVADSDFPDAA